MESIFNHIYLNIQKNGKLKENFTLDEYRTHTATNLNFEDGAEDGIIITHGTSKPSKKIIKEINTIIEKINEENTWQVFEKLEKCFDKYEKKQIKILPYIEPIIDEMTKNICDFKISIITILKLGINIILATNNIEMMKLGLTIFQLMNVSDFKLIPEFIEKIALCEEFTLYAVGPILLWKNANDVIFRLAKKTNGWGKIFLVENLQPTTENIKEWLITNGCSNNVNLGYLAKTVADKVDLINVLHRENLNRTELLGISDIMTGLLDEDNPHVGIEAIENSTELIESYLEHFKNVMDDIYFYHVPVLISRYIFFKENKTEEEEYIFEKIRMLIESKQSLNTLKKSILQGSQEERNLAIEVSSIDSNIPLGEEIYNIYKKDPFNNYFAFSYLLKFEEWHEKAIRLMQKSQDFKAHYELPEPILFSNDEYYTNLLDIIKVLKFFPFACSDIVAAGLMTKIMSTRKEALNTILEWKKISKKEINNFPEVIVDALKKLQKTEIIKSYKKIINELLNISEDLKKYVDPKVLIRDEDDNQNIDLFSEKLDDLFEYKVISRGINYFKEDMICSSIHYNNKYITYVQGSDFETEYEVEIEMKGTTIKKMKCNCPYEGNCKHEYASILYLREKLK